MDCRMIGFGQFILLTFTNSGYVILLKDLCGSAAVVNYT